MEAEQRLIRRFLEQLHEQQLEDVVFRLMRERGLSYRGLARATGLSAGYLNHIVHGNRPVPSNDVIAEVERRMGLKVSRIGVEYPAPNRIGGSRSRKTRSGSTGRPSRARSRGPHPATVR